MCGRYSLTSTPSEVAEYFGCDVRDNFPARYNIAPTQPIGVITMPCTAAAHDYASRHYHLLRWGFIPEWAGRGKDPDFARRVLINARSETVLQKPAFRNAFKRRRCLIPASGFYEWKNVKGEKNPFYCQRADRGLIAFAGIWETVLDPDGGEVDGAAVLTVAAGPDLKNIHHREPVVIGAGSFEQWLTADERDVDLLFPMLAPRPENFWQAFRVTRDVGNVRNDGERLIREVVPVGKGPEIHQGDLFS